MARERGWRGERLTPVQYRAAIHDALRAGSRRSVQDGSGGDRLPSGQRGSLDAALGAGRVAAWRLSANRGEGSDRKGPEDPRIGVSVPEDLSDRIRSARAATGWRAGRR